jgi:hypothetical protein
MRYEGQPVQSDIAIKKWHRDTSQAYVGIAIEEWHWDISTSGRGVTLRIPGQLRASESRSAAQQFENAIANPILLTKGAIHCVNYNDSKASNAIYKIHIPISRKISSTKECFLRSGIWDSPASPMLIKLCEMIFEINANLHFHPCSSRTWLSREKYDCFVA